MNTIAFASTDQTDHLSSKTSGLANCYHCGQEGEPHGGLTEDIDGTSYWFCCAGCATIAQTIHGTGLGSFYRHRANLRAPVEELDRDAALAHAVYDQDDVQRHYVRTVDAETVEVTLIVDNLRCAACVWLSEQHLERQPGVLAAHVNFATGRARIRWRVADMALSGILGAFAQIGYRALPFEPSAANQVAKREKKHLLMRMAVAMLGMMQVMMYALPVYTHESSMSAEHLHLLRWASLALTLPVVSYSAWPLLTGAWNSLRNRRPGMDVPVVIGILAAFGASTIATIRGVGEVYFDSVTMFVALLLAARYIELYVRHEAQGGSQALTAQLPAVCGRVPDYPSDREVQMVAVLQLQVGDVLRVRPGEAIPADGVVLEGYADVDEAILTGESHPVARTTGDRVLAGSYNCSSPLWMRVERVGADTRLAQIVQTLDRALEEKPRIAVLADQVAVWFVAALVLLAVLVGAVWWWLDPARALPVMVAVLVVSCPCALSLATPAALAAATAALARKGVLIVKGHALETLAQVSDVVLDKTGTLTKGRFSLEQTLIAADVSPEVCLKLAAAMEQGSSHPIGLALLAAEEEAGRAGLDEMAGVTAVRHLPGQGVEATWGDTPIRLGSRSFVSAFGKAAPDVRAKDEYAASADLGLADDLQAATLVWLGTEAGLLARFTLRDTLRDDTERMVNALSKQGLRLHLVSGDDSSTVAYWAHRLGIERAVGNVSPEGKKEYVARLQSNGAVVLAVGDGVNDAPLLALAQVSVAVASGTPLARASADAVLMGQGIMGVAHALKTAIRTRRVVRQNLGWALAYNLSFIPLAAVGLISAWMAAVGMSLSSLLVVGNAWRLRR